MVQKKQMISDIEESKLEQLNDDITLLGALRKIFFDKLPDTRYASEELSDEILGQILRANLKAIKLLEEGFKEIEKYKKVKIPEQKNQNPAR